MSKFLDLLERINEGAPAPLGFGVVRPPKLPAMVLVGLVSGDHTKGIAAVADLGLDAALLSGIDGPEGLKKLGDSLPGKPWGARLGSLSQEEAQAYQDSGSDLLAFGLDGTSASAVAEDEMARILCIDAAIDEQELRALASLPVDVFLIPLTQDTDTLTLRDLATFGLICRRSDQYILLEVSKPPGKKDLEALRDIGVHGLVVDVGSVDPDGINTLKTDLLDLPKPNYRRREKFRAILPGSVYSSGAAEPEYEEEEEEEEDDD
jgi:hypothetical protein